MSSRSYIYDNDFADARHRLRQLELIEDVETVGRLHALGVCPGWSCLEIGAGAGSIAEWLTDAVGYSGRVVATDVNPRHLDGSRYEVWRHDIGADQLPESEFDIVHMRHTLMHVGQQAHRGVLEKIYRALRPGGIALIEESDFSTWGPHSSVPENLSNTYRRGVKRVLDVYGSRGMDIGLGRALPRLMDSIGYADVRAGESNRSVTGGSEEAQFHRRTFSQLLSSLGEIPQSERTDIEMFIESFDDPCLIYTSRLTVSVSAVRPN